MQEIVIERDMALETRANIVLDPVMPLDFIGQFGEEARNAADRFNVPLAAEIGWVLRFLVGGSI
jgi:hypothetical protein